MAIPFLLSVCRAVAVGDPTPDKIALFARKQMEDRHIPGMSVAVVRNGQIMYANGFGLADISRSLPATADTVYLIASLSKQFTAAAIMVLVQEHKVSLDSPICPLLAGLNPPVAWQRVTVRNLLNQTSGIPELWKHVDLTNMVSTTPRKVVKSLRDSPLSFVPGSQYEYSNSNYYLLAQIVRTVSGESFDKFLSGRLFRPLHMDSTSSYDPSVKTSDRTTGYLLLSNRIDTNFELPGRSFLTGFGGIQTNVIDLAKWDAALYKNYPLTASSKLAMWKSPTLTDGQTSNYGFGWLIDNYHGHRLIWHNGALPGTTVWMGRFVDDKLTVIVLSNLRNIDEPDISVNQFAEIGKGIAGLYSRVLAPSTTAPKDASTHIDAALLAICSKASFAIALGHAQQDMFTTGAANALFPYAINQTTAAFQSLGSLKSCDGLYQQNKDGFIAITCRLTFTNTSLIYMFAVEPHSNKIAGIFPQN
jgi:D-alanyl-D-alanine carboxypeptidase